MSEKTLFLGCHLSTSGGYLAMGRTALEIGANTFAFFTRNPRGGNAKPLDAADVSALRELMDKSGFGPLVAHAPYTMNLCSAKAETVEFARRAMAEDLERMESLPGNYYNFHPGSHVKQGADKGIELICEGLNQVLVAGQSTRVLLETMAGKGTEVGRTFEELARIIDGVEHHERIGEGALGTRTFSAIVSEPRLVGLPMILETPNDLQGYAGEIALLRGLAAEGDVR